MIFRDFRDFQRWPISVIFRDFPATEIPEALPWVTCGAVRCPLGRRCAAGSAWASLRQFGGYLHPQRPDPPLLQNKNSKSHKISEF